MGDVDYKTLVLETLSELGGTARRPVVLHFVHKKLESQLSPYHCEGTESRPDYPRWKHHVDRARQELREDLCLEADSPRSVWELTARGRVRAKQ